MKKGIFWCANFDTEFPELITVSVVCDKNGNSKEPVQFSSKSGNNFNHRLEWERIDRKITKGQSFNYYPRGRVESKNRKATIYLNPDLNNTVVLNKIIEDFELKNQQGLKSIAVKSDGSSHYHYYLCNR